MIHFSQLALATLGMSIRDKQQPTMSKIPHFKVLKSQNPRQFRSEA